MPSSRRVVLVAFLALCITLPAHSQQHPKAKPEPSQQQPKGDRPGTHNSPLVVKVLDPEDAEERAAQAAQEREQEASLNRDLVQLTGILALIAGFQAALVVGQLYMMWLGIVTTRRPLRAYVSVSGGKILHEKRPDGWWLEWHPEITNVGQTPAYNFRVVARADIKPDPLPPGTDLTKELKASSPGSRITKAKSRAALAVGQTVWQHLDLNRSISEAELSERRNRRSTSGGLSSIATSSRRTMRRSSACWPIGTPKETDQSSLRRAQ